ncbi:hypothetical protein Tco_0205939 [Tanacetum coccineum]
MTTLAEFMILSGGDNRLPIVAKDLWERIQLLMQGTSLTKQERECKLYDAFDKFAHIKGESLHQYYLRFTQLINDMNIYKMKLEQLQIDTTTHLAKLSPNRPLPRAFPVLNRDDPIDVINKIGKVTWQDSAQNPRGKEMLRDIRITCLLVEVQGNGKVLNEKIWNSWQTLPKLVLMANFVLVIDNPDFSPSFLVFQMSNPSTDSSDASPVKVDVPSELPKVSLVNASLKKLKFYLAQFDSVVKKRITPDALTEDIVNIVVNSSENMNASVNVNSSTSMNDSVNYVEMCNKCLKLEAELIKQHNMVEKDEYNKLQKAIST